MQINNPNQNEENNDTDVLDETEEAADSFDNFGSVTTMNESSKNHVTSKVPGRRGRRTSPWSLQKLPELIIIEKDKDKDGLEF